jgi:anti-anti-sigma regulatory factor
MAEAENGRRGKRTRPPTAAEPTVGPTCIALAPRMTYAEAGLLLDRLRAAKDAPEVILEAGAVERMSTSAVLVIVSFLNARADRVPPAAVLGASGAFVDAFSDLGLFSDLMKMEFRA